MKLENLPRIAQNQYSNYLALGALEFVCHLQTNSFEGFEFIKYANEGRLEDLASGIDCGSNAQKRMAKFYFKAKELFFDFPNGSSHKTEGGISFSEDLNALFNVFVTMCALTLPIEKIIDGFVYSCAVSPKAADVATMEGYLSEVCCKNKSEESIISARETCTEQGMHMCDECAEGYECKYYEAPECENKYNQKDCSNYLDCAVFIAAIELYYNCTKGGINGSKLMYEIAGRIVSSIVEENCCNYKPQGYEKYDENELAKEVLSEIKEQLSYRWESIGKRNSTVFHPYFYDYKSEVPLEDYIDVPKDLIDHHNDPKNNLHPKWQMIKLFDLNKKQFNAITYLAKSSGYDYETQMFLYQMLKEFIMESVD